LYNEERPVRRFDAAVRKPRLIAVHGQHADEVARGERFEFGANWTRFLETLDDHRIETATESLKSLLAAAGLEGKAFLDVGCGSGLFSLAARRLGARVFSFDYDPRSVQCAMELRRRYDHGSAERWTITEGSALDRAFLGSLGRFDLVYSWGVLHHTGEMWKALANMVDLVRPGGLLFVAIYNDQGSWSNRWLSIKKRYNRGPRWSRPLIVAAVGVYFWWKPAIADLLTGRPGAFWRAYKKNRGMSPLHDLVDWVGGYPFEVAKPEEIFHFYRDRGFSLINLKTIQNHGCNEFVFRKETGPLCAA
jgi:2-polyprenyl-6-hydroxyphenyl methylase/3-demethylubiquinone-9 3-methyltransferase